MRLLAICLAAVLSATCGVAQTSVALGDPAYDSSAPVEVSADQLDIDQSNGQATFRGNVVIGQGDLRLTGEAVEVTYGTADQTAIERLRVTGGVTMATAGEAAEAQEAIYTLASGVVVLTGDVILTQGQNAMAGEKLTVRLSDGTGVMEGRVRVIFRPEANQ